MFVVQKVLCTIFALFSIIVDASFVLGNPQIRAYPCIGTENVMEIFTQNQSPETENMYDIFIPVNTMYPDGLVSLSTINIQFDATTNLTLKKNFGRVKSKGDGKFEIQFHTAVDDYLSMKVRGQRGKPVPNLISLIINGDELCPNGTKTGIWDPYILGDVTSGVSSLVEPSSDPGCGRKKIEHTALITNAEDTKPGDWPWHVAIYRTNARTQRYICGGSLLTTSRVLTAGHCVVQSRVKVIPERLFVVLGKYNLAGGDLASLEVGVYKVDLHEDFDPQTLINDIAMLVLLSEVPFGDYIQPICLWDRNNGQPGDLYGKLGYVVGWGFNEDNVLSNTLAQTTMPIVPDLTCLRSNVLFFGKYLTPNTFCAGFRNGTSVCNGDSGGGMFLSEEGDDGKVTWRLKGIVSLSVSQKDVSLCDPNNYVIFTDVAKYMDWIEERI